MANIITLGGVSLNPSMIWLERYSVQSIAQSVKYTLGGNPVIFARKLRAGVPLTLQGGNDYGWLKKEVVDQVLELASDPAGVYSLQFGSQTMQVAFRHNESPAVAMNPFVPRVEHEPGDYMIGQIKLLTL